MGKRFSQLLNDNCKELYNSDLKSLLMFAPNELSILILYTKGVITKDEVNDIKKFKIDLAEDLRKTAQSEELRKKILDV